MIRCDTKLEAIGVRDCLKIVESMLKYGFLDKEDVKDILEYGLDEEKLKSNIKNIVYAKDERSFDG